ncbi:hypothetical protein HPB48_002183 [Haemaphysalis longicornis]|uniref:Uncharacterized protein n=1 Tax=Haemaphysalis longicornis TaxID=44386 RepID=A0A9J6FGS2_HAELO|nr:hypothetical protein HPB48_002183 [Haemaphysalis longicornis]
MYQLGYLDKVERPCFRFVPGPPWTYRDHPTVLGMLMVPARGGSGAQTTLRTPFSGGHRVEVLPDMESSTISN